MGIAPDNAVAAPGIVEARPVDCKAFAENILAAVEEGIPVADPHVLVPGNPARGILGLDILVLSVLVPDILAPDSSSSDDQCGVVEIETDLRMHQT